MTDVQIAEENCRYSESCGFVPLTEDEADFLNFFGREPEPYDRRLGLRRICEVQRSLMQLLSAERA